MFRSTELDELMDPQDRHKVESISTAPRSKLVPEDTLNHRYHGGFRRTARTWFVASSTAADERPTT